MTDIFEDWDSAELTDDEIVNYNGPSSKYPLEDVQLAVRLVDSTGIIDRIDEWRKEERYLAGKRNGGRKPYITDRTILVVLMLLAREGRPLLLTEMGNVLHKRFTDEGRELLGLPESLTPSRPGKNGTEKKNWFNAAYNAFHRMVDVMDPHLDTKQHRHHLTDRAHRERILRARDQNTVRRRKERLNEFAAAFIDMTFMQQPREVRQLQKKLDLTLDQTPITTLARAARPKLYSTGPRKGQEVKERMVLDPDLGWYVKGGTDEKEAIPAYAANVIVNTAPTPGVKPGFPIIVRGLSLSTPGKDVSGETVALLRHLIEDLGHDAGRLTADRGYFAAMDVNDFHRPVQRLGFAPVFDYKRNQLGIQPGGVHGSIFIDGEHYCPGTPQGLIDASKRAEAKEISEGTMRDLVDQRAKWVLKNRSRPDADGTVKKRCPAYGPQATVTCPLREPHPDLSDDPRPRVSRKRLPVGTPDICCKSSVVFKETDKTIKFSQAYRYGSRKWAEIYDYDRNTSEGIHGFMKDAAHEALDAPKRRRAFGLGAQQVLVTMLVVSANMRKIASWTAEQQKPGRPATQPTLRRRDREGLSNYKKHWGDKATELSFDRLVEEPFKLKPRAKTNVNSQK